MMALFDWLLLFLIRCNMFNEYDIVELVHSISDKLKNGTLGVIVIVYSEDKFEVEFFDNNKNTIEVRSVSANQIKLVQRK